MAQTNKGDANRTGPPPAGDSRRNRRVREQEERRAAEARRRHNRLLLRVALAATVLAVLVVGGYLLFNRPAQTASGARLVPDQGNEHVRPGQAHPPYNTTPPTSGWHYANEAPWGIHDNPIDDEAQVHNLEHGGIMVQYWCPDGCPELVGQLKGVVGRYRSKVILAPYAKPLPNRIALTAWRWIDTFEEFDEARIVSFIERYRNRGPEQVPD